MNRSEAASLARTLMNQHGLGNWVFEWDGAKRRAGACHHTKHKITLSIHYAERNAIDLVKDTILHEIAHALAGPGKGHGWEWKQICIRIGAKPVRCYSSDADMPEGKWKACCGGCTKLFTKHRQPKRNGWTYCVKCGPDKGKLSYSLNFTTPKTVVKSEYQGKSFGLEKSEQRSESVPLTQEKTNMATMKVTAKELAEKMGVEYAIAAGFLKLMVAQGVAKEVEKRPAERGFGKPSNVYEMPADTVTISLTKVQTSAA
jgi:predicted SprT family Zn-dependent metalloprotease